MQRPGSRRCASSLLHCDGGALAGSGSSKIGASSCVQAAATRGSEAGDSAVDSLKVLDYIGSGIAREGTASLGAIGILA